MSFLSGSILWNLLWIIPLILVLAIAGGVRRTRLLRKMFGTDERAARFSNASPGKRVFRIVLLTLVVLLLAVAAARPSWGKQLMHDTSTGRDLLVVFDVSKSMLSDDVKPSRMDHAKWLVREIVKKNPGDRFGLIAFAGESFLVCPLTMDRASFIQLVDDLDVDTIPVGGTNIQLALEEAVKAFEGAQGTHKAVVLVTDGDELVGRGASVVNDLAKAQIPVFAVGVGDPSNPAVIRVKDEDGKYRILTDRDGNPVKSPLNEPQLTELARRTGGIYVRSTAAYSGIDALETRIRMLDRKAKTPSPRSAPSNAPPTRSPPRSSCSRSSSAFPRRVRARFRPCSRSPRFWFSRYRVNPARRPHRPPCLLKSSRRRPARPPTAGPPRKKRPRRSPSNPRPNSTTAAWNSSRSSTTTKRRAPSTNAPSPRPKRNRSCALRRTRTSA